MWSNIMKDFLNFDNKFLESRLLFIIPNYDAVVWQDKEVDFSDPPSSQSRLS